MFLNVAMPGGLGEANELLRTRGEQSWRGWDDLGTTYRGIAGGRLENMGILFERIALG
ncbi:hypothetical protein ABT297_24840 [Dactylosporangium sp. NPDC000555]|uniref:hypothetical protein n=1 Tax=Dactylosporangium sp. NPDC000555 TaxID=3154260 RepID=UPI003330F7C0